MKNIFNQCFAVFLFAMLFFSCKKDETKEVLVLPKAVSGFTSSTNSLVLSASNDSASVVSFKWAAPNYGAKVPVGYTLQFTVPSDTTGSTAWSKAKSIVIASDSLQKTFLGTDFNALLATQLGLPTNVVNTIVVRLVADVKTAAAVSTVASIYATLTLTAKPYNAIVVYPALLVKGGNSWVTPATRTNAYLLASEKYDNKYEGYLNLPNADGWGGDALQLISSTTGSVYGWGSSSTTMSIGGGNLWFTPSPNYMKVNADITALTITYTPVKFFLSGDHNGWSTSATPMTFNSATNKWVATNVSLTAGKVFVFTSNGTYDISYKVDATGKLIYAGPPSWAGNNIAVTQTGVFTVTLDLSGGAGNYQYSIQ